jgi:hypothetical protein
MACPETGAAGWSWCANMDSFGPTALVCWLLRLSPFLTPPKTRIRSRMIFLSLSHMYDYVEESLWPKVSTRSWLFGPSSASQAFRGHGGFAEELRKKGYL